MDAILHGIIITLAIFLIFNSYESVFAIELNSTASNMTNNFTKNLKSKINNLITNALNASISSMNSSSSSQINGSNLTSSQVYISKSKAMSTMSSNGSGAEGNSIIKDKVTTINGICSSVKVGGNGNDTLFSSGNCNDELTGGKGADKFTCGEGNDTVKDHNPKEGDIILDRPNCEKVL